MWSDKQILSAQAMLLGMYPPKKNNYVLRDDQLERAVHRVDRHVLRERLR